MAAKRIPKDELDETATRSKLGRLLETETEIDAMLSEARREATEIVEHARASAERRMRALEHELDASRRELEKQVATERDGTLAELHSRTEQSVRALDELDERTIAELAQYVLDRLVHATSGGEP